MKYKGTEKSSAEQATTYVFSMGIQEARLVRDVLIKFVNDTRNVFEVMPVRNRARTIIKRIEQSVPLHKKP